jgi:hypothetical protein
MMEELLCLECSLDMLGGGDVGVGSTRVCDVDADVDVDAAIVELDVETEGVTDRGAAGGGTNEGLGVDASVSMILE